MNLMDLYVKISVDDQASSQVEALSGKLKSGLATAAKVGVAAVAAAGTAVAAIGKQSIEQYAEYEQLVGGVETLFKQSADVVQQYAANAYKTAGMSANEYMDTVTSFSASLLQSLEGDTAAAAEKANLAITDMSDNANKMGTSMEMIQNAYQGFSKQNYTMLDNLKLGYGGTQAEMQRLLDDAEKLSGQKFDLSSYSDIVDAIHVVQTEMGITGTTAKEASTTIQGSLATVKSAWENLLIGVSAGSGNIDTLINSFVESVAVAGENLLPRVQTALSGMSQVITSFSSTIVPMFVDTLIDNAPALISSGADMIFALVDGIIENIDVLVAAGIDLVVKLAEAISDPERSETIGEAAVSIIIALVTGLINATPRLISAAANLVFGIITGITNETDKLVMKGMDIVMRIDEGVKKKIAAAREWGRNLLEGLWNGITDKVEWLKGKVSGVVDTIKSWFTGKEGFDTHSPSKWAGNIGGYIMQGLSIGMENSKGEVMDTVGSISQAMKTGTVSFADSMIAKATLPVVNAVAQNSRPSNNQGETSFNLVLPDGVKLASYLFRPFVQYAAANGTPILNPT